MKKLFTVVIAFAAVCVFYFEAAAAESIKYYDEYGNQVTVNGMYYNNEGYPMFNAKCYYIDENGDFAYVGGMRSYYYDADENFTPCMYYYDVYGNPVEQPDSYPGGWGCGMFCYRADGSVASGVFYYDEYGNAVQPSAGNRRGGCCGRW